MKSDILERCFEFAKRVVLLCRFLDSRPGVSRTLANQLLRSGTSIGANVEEGQASQSEEQAQMISNFTLQTSNFKSMRMEPSLFLRIPCMVLS